MAYSVDGDRAIVHEDDSIFEMLERPRKIPRTEPYSQLSQIPQTRSPDFYCGYITPTEPDSPDEIAPTEVDSPDEIAPAEVDSPWGSLCGWWGPAPPPPSPSPPSEYDSELTDDEDPYCNARKLCPPAPIRPHHLVDPTFLDLVVDETRMYAQAGWFSFAPFIGYLTSDFDANVELISGRISSGLAPAGSFYKIGICRDPHWRWFVCDGGHYARFWDPRQ